MPPSHNQPSNKKRRIWLWFHRFGSPEYLYRLCTQWGTRFALVALVLLLYGIYQGLVVAPRDYQMGDSYRILFIHAPSAWMSLFAYIMMAVFSFIGLVWKIKTAYMSAKSCAYIGITFTVITLVTGALWGKPTWGTYWFWDARLTSELILLFLYLGYIALNNAIENRNTANRAASLLAIIGVINIPIIHFSVEWWNTLHQGASVMRLATPSIHGTMLPPLFIMFVAINFYFIAALCQQIRYQILLSESKTRWVQKIL